MDKNDKPQHLLDYEVARDAMNPLGSVQTYEPSRVLAELVQSNTEAGWRTAIWRAGRGLEPVQEQWSHLIADEENARASKPEPTLESTAALTSDPGDVISYIKGWLDRASEIVDEVTANRRKADRFDAEFDEVDLTIPFEVIILVGFGMVLDKAFDNVGLAQSFLDIAETANGSGRMVVVVDSSIKWPTMVDKLTVNLEWPLPNLDEMQDTVRRMADTMRSRGTVEMDDDLEWRLASALTGLTMERAELVLREAFVAHDSTLDQRALAYCMKEKVRIINATGMLEVISPKLTMEQIGGLDNFKKWIELVHHSNSLEAVADGVTPIKGFLLVGVPGTGKSAAIQAASMGKLIVVRVDIGSLMNSLVGESEKNLRYVLTVLKAMAPVVAWFDEIEKGIGSGGERDGGTSSRMLGTLLTAMQEIREPIMWCATANDLQKLERNFPEMLRRFERVWAVGLPVHSERVQIAAVHLNLNPYKDWQPYESESIEQLVDLMYQDFDLDAIADATEGYSGAEIETAVKGGVLAASATSADNLKAEHVIQYASTVKPLSETAAQRIDEMKNAAAVHSSASSLTDWGTTLSKGMSEDMDRRGDPMTKLKKSKGKAYKEVGNG